jgi:hypothetical protein
VNAHGTAEIIRAIGGLWPLILIGATIGFRKAIGRQVRALLKEVRTWRLRSLKLGPLAVELWDTVADESRAILAGDDTPPPPPDRRTLLDEFGDYALIAPVTAIVQAHTRVEEALRERLGPEQSVDPSGRAMSASALARRALRLGLIRASVVPAIEGLTALRDLAVHQQATTYDRARDYFQLADMVLYALSVPVSGHSRELVPKS